MKMYYETSVITRLSRRAFMDSLFFFHLIFFFFVQFKTFNIWNSNKKKKKKNVFRGRNTSEIEKKNYWTNRVNWRVQQISWIEKSFR